MGHLQAREAAVRVVRRLARQPAVDHHAHAGQRHRRLGHVGRQYHAAATLGIGLQGFGLFFHRQFAVQGQHDEVFFPFSLREKGPGGPAPDLIRGRMRGERSPVAGPIATFVTPLPNPSPGGRGAQHRLHPRDLALARQEHQHIAGVREHGVFDGAARLYFDRLVPARGKVRHLHREATAFAAQPRRIEEPRQLLAVQRGGHHDDAQVLAQLRLHVQRQCQAEIARQMALVEFVEQDRPDPLQHRIVLDHPGQDAFGDHLDPRVRPDFVLETDAVADRAADRFAPLPGHEAGRRARRHAARLQHHDLAALQPRLVQQRQRHLGGLAGTGRGLQHQARMVGQAADDVRQQRGDGERGRWHAVRRIRPAASVGAT